MSCNSDNVRGLTNAKLLQKLVDGLGISDLVTLEVFDSTGNGTEVLGKTGDAVDPFDSTGFSE